MSSIWSTIRTWGSGVLVVFFFCSTSVLAKFEDRSADAKAVAAARARVLEVLRYFKLDAAASSEDVDHLAVDAVRLATTTATMEEREAAIAEILNLGNTLQGLPAPPKQVLDFVVPYSSKMSQILATSPDARPLASQEALPGKPGHVERIGTGPVPMILLPDIFTDWRLYESFMRRNAERYTMFAVTLPGEGGTPSLAPPSAFDVGATPYWDNAERIVLEMIEGERLDRPVLVGTQAGAYLAARVAIHHPEKVRRAVLLNGLVNMPMRSKADPERPASREERLKAVRVRWIATMLIQALMPQRRLGPEGAKAMLRDSPQSVRTSLLVNTRDVARGEALFLDGLVASDMRSTYEYSNELSATDLTGDFATLATPTLVIPSIHDDGSPGEGGPGLAQWTEMRVRYPSIPLQILPFENTRSYALLEAPEDLDAAIAEFVAGREVKSRRSHVRSHRESPSASVSQQIGAVEATVAYSRPQVKGREVWGAFIPYDRVWRAGANEATTISFSGDVVVGDQPLAAGRYSLFAIPGKEDWTLIFNRVPTQWGAFFYNAEFDAVRVKVKAEPVEPHEWLTYSFDLLSGNSARLALTWDRLQVAVTISGK